MSIRFETEVNTSFFGRPDLVVKSTHYQVSGALQNMFDKKPGTPMLDIADAMELRAILDNFIRNHCLDT